jgi:2-polyprenyl-3-methyl-5-hydroxy-6-metoxy-1,4-benzoquinol methylase
MHQVSYASYSSENVKDGGLEMKTCPYCENYAVWYFTNYRRAYYRCSRCDLIFQIISKSYDDAVDTYKKNYFDEYSHDQLEGQRAKLHEHILKLILRDRKVGRLLDVGTGCGFFLVAARMKEWEVKGIEPSLQSTEVARRDYNLDVFPGTLRKFSEKGQFDAITFINVLEHSPMPWLEIDLAKKFLRPGGLIYLRFPNGFLHSRVYRMACKAGLHNSLRNFLVFHKYSFTSKYIRRLLHDQGFIETTIFNSPPVPGDPYKIFPHPILSTYIKRLVHLFSQSSRAISGGEILLGTSLEVTAAKRADI